MISERNLIREIKRAHKNEGYIVQKVGGAFQIKTGYAAVQVHEDFIPSKVLGLLAEHIREIPSDPWLVRKGMLPQKAMDGINSNIFSQPDGAADCHKTSLTLDGYEIWQNYDLTCSLFDGDLTGIVDLSEGGMSIRQYDHYLRIDNGTECVVVCAVVIRDDVRIDELGKFQWWRD